ALKYAGASRKFLLDLQANLKVYGSDVDSMIGIAELGKQTGLSTSALRYYESRGLLEADARTPAGYRLYSERALCRAGFIQRAKALGLTLQEIERVLKESSDLD